MIRSRSIRLFLALNANDSLDFRSLSCWTNKLNISLSRPNRIDETQTLCSTVILPSSMGWRLAPRDIRWSAAGTRSTIAVDTRKWQIRAEAARICFSSARVFLSHRLPRYLACTRVYSIYFRSTRYPWLDDKILQLLHRVKLSLGTISSLKISLRILPNVFFRW